MKVRTQAPKRTASVAQRSEQAAGPGEDAERLEQAAGPGEDAERLEQAARSGEDVEQRARPARPGEDAWRVCRWRDPGVPARVRALGVVSGVPARVRALGVGRGAKRRGSALAALSLVACATTGGATATGVGQPAPAEIGVKTLDGGYLTLASLRGKVVLLDVWASWCEPCKQELPMLDEMAGRLKDRGVQILAVSIDEERGNVDRFVSSRARWTLTLAHDPDKQIAERLQPEKMPSSYLIDRAGIIRQVNSGFVPEDARRIESQLIELSK